MSFAKTIKALSKKYEGNMEKAVRHYALALFSNVVYASPVDTGRFRGNWQCSINTYQGGVLDKTDVSGSTVISKIQGTVAGMKVGDAIYLTNNLPYAIRLEYGWSKQAPQGMVRLSVMKVQAALGGKK